MKLILIFLLIKIQSQIEIFLKILPPQYSDNPQYTKSTMQLPPKNGEAELETKNRKINNLLSPFSVNYIGNFEIGTPPRKFSVLLNVGSSDIWILNKGCTNCEGHHYYDSEYSTSFFPSGEDTSLTYGDGIVSGSVASETITLENLTVQNQSVLLANYVQLTGFEGIPFDGIVGLSFSSLSMIGNTFIDNLKSKGKIKNRNFAFDTKISKFYLGLDDKNTYNNHKIKYFKITNENYWIIHGEMLIYGGYMISINSIMISNSDSFIFVNNQIYSTMLYALGTKNASEFCMKEDYDYPHLIIQLDGLQLTMRMEDYIFSNSVNCFGIQNISIVDSDILLGNIFFNKYFVIFDLDEKQVGFESNSIIISMKIVVLLLTLLLI